MLSFVTVYDLIAPQYLYWQSSSHFDIRVGLEILASCCKFAKIRKMIIWF